MALKGIAYSIMPTRAYLYLRWGAYKYHYGSSFPLRQNDRKIASTEQYSLKPYDDTKSIFIHIPKCAGVSVCRALYGCLAGGHATLDEYLQIFEPKSLYNYFKFTIVRNPWDRLVSAYHFLKSGGFSETDKIWSDKELGQYTNFTDFCINWVNSDNIWKYCHFMPQYHYIVDRHRKIPLEFIGYLENLNEDFEYIAKALEKTYRLIKAIPATIRITRLFITKQHVRSFLVSTKWISIYWDIVLIIPIFGSRLKRAIEYSRRFGDQ